MVRSVVFLPERAVLMILRPPSRAGRVSGSPGLTGPRTAWAGVCRPCPPAYLRRDGAGGEAGSPPFATRWASACFMAAARPRSRTNSCLPCLNAWGGCSGEGAGWPWMQVSLILIFDGSDLTREADPASAGISRTAVSLVLIWGNSDPACGAGCTSEWKSSRTAASLVLICVRFIRSPGDSPARSPPSLVETASRVLIRGRSRGDGSRGECCSPGAAGDGGSAGISCVGGSAVVRSSPSVSRPLADFFFFRRASTPRRA